MSRKYRYGMLMLVLTLAVLLLFIMPNHLMKIPQITPQAKNKLEIKLPQPVLTSQTSIEEALLKRRSLRAYKNASLTIQEAGQLLWAAQGITSRDGFRTAPSAGARYPLEIYLVAGNIEGLTPGVYHYIPEKHTLEKVKDGDLRMMLCKSAIQQESVKLAAGDLVITAVYSRTTQKYGDRGKRFVLMEAGHAAQNIYLQSVALKLGTVSIGAFNGRQIKNVLGIQEEPLYIMPIGKI